MYLTIISDTHRWLICPYRARIKRKTSTSYRKQKHFNRSSVPIRFRVHDQLRSVFINEMFLIAFVVIWLSFCYYLCKRSQISSDSSPVSRSQDELSEKSLLATKKDELDASSRQWKSRVEKSDAEKFSVAGKMSERIRDATPTINIKDVDENEKKTPQAKRFKLKG